MESLILGLAADSETPVRVKIHSEKDVTRALYNARREVCTAGEWYNIPTVAAWQRNALERDVFADLL